MNAADKILIIGGVVNLSYGLLTGLVAGSLRTRQPDVPKYLMLAHIGPLMFAPILLGLVHAIELSPLSAAWEIGAATMMVSASAVLAAKDTLNWSKGVADEFVERPLGFYLGAVSSVLSCGAVVIFAVGVFVGLY